MFYNNKKNFMTSLPPPPPPPPSTNFSKDFPEKFFRSFKKKYRAKERCRKKNSCKQLGVKKKFVHRKIAQPPPQISNGPPLNSHLQNFQVYKNTRRFHLYPSYTVAHLGIVWKHIHLKRKDT